MILEVEVVILEVENQMSLPQPFQDFTNALRAEVTEDGCLSKLRAYGRSLKSNAQRINLAHLTPTVLLQRKGIFKI